MTNDLDNVIDGFKQGEKIQSTKLKADDTELLELVNAIKDPFSNKNGLLKAEDELKDSISWGDLLYTNPNPVEDKDGLFNLSTEARELIEKISHAKNTTTKNLIIEALNDLFIKYDEDPIL